MKLYEMPGRGIVILFDTTKGFNIRESWLASVLILTLCPENGSIYDPFMTLDFDSFDAC